MAEGRSQCTHMAGNHEWRRGWMHEQFSPRLTKARCQCVSKSICTLLAQGPKRRPCSPSLAPTDQQTSANGWMERRGGVENGEKTRALVFLFPRRVNHLKLWCRREFLWRQNVLPKYNIREECSQAEVLPYFSTSVVQYSVNNILRVVFAPMALLIKEPLG